jgi:CheY-like chemotaxis protein
MEVVGQLTGGVAHDFNNLLTVISGNLHLLWEGADGGKASPDLIVRALQAVERGADLPQRLLAFSRTQTLQPAALLSKLGYQIIEAPDAKAALALLRRSGSVDLLFSDIALPGELNGTDLAIEVRAGAPGIKIVLMSGLAQSDVDGEKAAEHGFHFIQKPFGKPVLANTIRKALDG